MSLIIPRPRLSAYLRHRPRRANEAGVVDPVFQLLVADRVTQQGNQLVVAGAVAKRRLQIPFAPRKEACAQLAVRGDANAVARRAEWLGHRVHEAELAGAVGETKPARSRRGLRRQLLEWAVKVFDDRADLTAREDVVLAPRFVRV